MGGKGMGYLPLIALLVGGLLVSGNALAVTVNTPAPDFTLPSTTGEAMSLSQFRGKKMVLIEFYGINFANTCTKNLTARMVDFEAFKGLDVQILGISVDDTFSQQTFADSLGLPFPLLSDAEAKVTHLYAVTKLLKEGTDLAPVMLPGKGVQLQRDRIGASQAFFLIDKQGIVRGRWLPGDMRPFSSEEMLEMARRLAGTP
jgi:peroxiredoxin Q/BCP